MKTEHERQAKLIGRRYRLIRREAVKLFQEFVESFDIHEFVRPKPFFFPRWLWNMIVNSILIHRKK